MKFTEAFKISNENNKRMRHEKFLEGRWFKVVDSMLFVDAPEPYIGCDVHYDIGVPMSLVLDNGWEVEEHWYDRLSEKYPNGVFCKVHDDKYCIWAKAIIVDYIDGFFIDKEGLKWNSAIPLSRLFAPAFLEDIKEVNYDRRA